MALPATYHTWDRHRRRQYWAHRRAVRAKEDASPLYQPTQPLSGAQLRTSAQKITNLQLKPQLDAVTTEEKQVNRQYPAAQAKSADYYKGLATQAAGDFARQQAIAAGLNTTLAGIGTTAQDRIAAAKGDVAASAQADASLRGAGLGGGGDQRVLDELAAQQARSAANSQAAQTGGAIQGANYQAFSVGAGQATAARGGEQQGEIANMALGELAKLRAKRADIKATAGDLYTKNLTEMRQNEFNNYATAQALDIKRDTLKSTDLNKAADRKLKAMIARSNRITRQRIAAVQHGDRVETNRLTGEANKAKADIEAYKRKHGYYDYPGGHTNPKNTKSDPAAFTGTQIRSNRETLDKLRAFVKDNDYKPGDYNNFLLDQQDDSGNLKHSPAMLKGAFLSAKYGGVDAKTRTEFHRRFGVWLPLQKKVRGK